MDGPPCPVCGRLMGWASTHNEWEYVCEPCGHRYNRRGERMDLAEQEELKARAHDGPRVPSPTVVLDARGWTWTNGPPDTTMMNRTASEKDRRS